MPACVTVVPPLNISYAPCRRLRFDSSDRPREGKEETTAAPCRCAWSPPAVDRTKLHSERQEPETHNRIGKGRKEAGSVATTPARTGPEFPRQSPQARRSLEERGKGNWHAAMPARLVLTLIVQGLGAYQAQKLHTPHPSQEKKVREGVFCFSDFLAFSVYPELVEWQHCLPTTLNSQLSVDDSVAPSLTMV